MRDFLQELCKIAGIDDKPTFTRSVIVNNQEEMQLLIQAAQFLPQDYTTRKILELLGDGDKADEILKQMAADELARAQEEAEMEEGGETPTTPIQGQNEAI